MKKNLKNKMKKMVAGMMLGVSSAGIATCTEVVNNDIQRTN